jgi:glycosyltransferase involved in cell wall biosynthesis
VSGAKVSVVVPAHHRPMGLAATLAGLRNQTLPASAFEVIVVDDGSVDSGIEAVLRAERERGELALTVIHHEVAHGPGAARNSGWRAAAAPLVAFTDDDCVPDPRWLEAGLRVAGTELDTLVQGRTEPDPAAVDPAALFSRTVVVRSLGPQFETCNIFYPRALLERLGGFDETFGLVPGGEDTDLAWRALEQGGGAAFAPDAVVFHAVHQLGPRGALREATRWVETVRVFAVHPGARRMLNRGVFWNGWHYCVIRSLVALALPGWARRLLLTRHALQLTARAREAGAGPWAVPFLLLYDVVETASVVRGGIRHRTLVV